MQSVDREGLATIIVVFVNLGDLTDIKSAVLGST